MLSKEQKRKIYERIRKRYKRYAKRLGKPLEWKKVELYGKIFADALRQALIAEEERLAMGEEESNLKVSREIGQGEEHSKKSNTFLTDDFITELKRELGETPERRAERKSIEREFNEEIEEYHRTHTCQICKSNPCHCEED